MANRKIDELIHESRLALTNAKNESMQEVLAPFGYDEERLDAGLALVDEVEEGAQRQQAEYADQYAATSALDEATGEAEALYLRHVKLARVAFEPDEPGYVELNLRGNRRDDRAGWLVQARQFYTTLRSEPELAARMAELTVDEAAASRAEALLDEVAQRDADRQKERGEAQEATRQRNASADVLRGFMSDFYRVARVATEDRPQLREQIGLVTSA